LKIGIDARCLEWGRGGVARYLINMLKIWPKITTKHHFILYFQNYIPDDDFLRNPLFHLKLLEGPKFLRSHRILAEQFLMPNQLKKDNLNLFFATWYSSPLMYPGNKTIVAAWDISYSTHPKHYSWVHRISLGYFSRKSCERAAGVVTCSDFDAKQIEKYYVVPSKKILTVYLAADHRFKPKPDKKEITRVTEKYKLPSKFILSMGVIHNRRNIDVIINSFEQLKDEVRNYSLVVIGRNSTQPHIDIKGMMKKMIKEGRALYIPWFEDEDLPALYHAAHCYICTSTVDGETLMLKEAMQSGTPVITSPLLKGTIGGHGLIIKDPENVLNTTQVLRIATGQDFERNQRIKNGIKWTQNISWERAANESLAFLESR
jgi:glycosyltransferase involved in cell wall biosynthesis